MLKNRSDLSPSFPLPRSGRGRLKAPPALGEGFGERPTSDYPL